MEGEEETANMVMPAGTEEGEELAMEILWAEMEEKGK